MGRSFCLFLDMNRVNVNDEMDQLEPEGDCAMLSSPQWQASLAIRSLAV
jgi:hypothetical protein